MGNIFLFDRYLWEIAHSFACFYFFFSYLVAFNDNDDAFISISCYPQEVIFDKKPVSRKKNPEQ